MHDNRPLTPHEGRPRIVLVATAGTIAGPAPEQAGLCVTIGDGILRMALCGDAPGLTRGAATALGQSLRAEILRALDLAAGVDGRAIVR